jgi:hypothetical protein
MSRMLCLTISEADAAAAGTEDGNPLLVVQVDGPLIRRVMALILDDLVGEPGPEEPAGEAL